MSSTVVRVILGLALIAAVGVGIHQSWRHYEKLVVERGRLAEDVTQLKTSNADQATENTKLRAEIRARDKLLEQRAEFGVHIASLRGEFNAKLEELRKADEATREWMDQLLPPALRERLRDGAGGHSDHDENRKGSAAPDLADGNAVAAVLGRQQR